MKKEGDKLDYKSLKIEVVTSMLSHGSNKNKLEIRIPEIKASMRFWWRALSNFEKISDMKKQEGEIFGDSENYRCPFSIIPSNGFSISKAEETRCILGYRKDYKKDKTIKISKKGISSNKIFSIRIQKRFNYGKSLDFYVDLLKLVSMLGGLGQRSRRGYGCFSIKDMEYSSKDSSVGKINNNIWSIMKRLGFSRNYRNESYSEISRKFTNKQQYPLLKAVYIGAALKRKDFFDKIKSSIDENRNKDTRYLLPKKLASPVYVTCINKNDEFVYPVICSLKNKNLEENRKNESLIKSYNEYLNTFRSELICPQKN